MEQPPMSWPEQLDDGSLITAPADDEFSNFLEFGMQFPDLEGHGPGASQHSQQHSLANPSTTRAPDSEMVHMDTEPTSHPMQYGQLDMSDFNGQSQSHQLAYSASGMTPGFCAPDHSRQRSLQPSPASHYMQGQPMIPPTPNSMEMHGNAARYPQRVDENQEMYDRYARINEEQALYTPLVSPAMTPLENQFRLPEYTIPGEYFTPLTSPALEAQNANQSNNSGYPFHHRQVSDVGFVPTSAESNPLPGTSSPSSPHIIRKSGRRRPSTSRVTGRSKVKQSPSIRAQQRKKSTLSMNSEELFNNLDKELNTHKPLNHDVCSLQASSNEGSGQDSVSPEPLSEPLMPPPALPPPRRSPAIAPQHSRSQPAGAATPATLMRLRSQHSPDPSDQFTGQAQLAPPEYQDEVMEDISLPEAATPSQRPRPKVSRVDTAIRSNTISPANSANATPTLELRSTSTDQPPSWAMAPSPRTVIPSPSGPVPKKSDSSATPVSNRKRQSLSTTHASPQLRPKISPNIQPLMRGDGMSHDTSSIYLASKSNYQHILDGTLPSGVSYPESLAENLSSKRTNHKLAEQGRRNRINNALKEIEALIPPAFIQARQATETAANNASKAGEKEKDKSNNQPISKATAVEMAIDYIKLLKTSLDEASTKLALAEAKLAAGDRAQDGSTSDTSSSATNKTAVNGTTADSMSPNSK
ncbi:hypothetical protein N7474_001498 [Penicillium riverlandense]|uniref:uncharacterized protein n=1 Tax=Penicillium riverlandense TaxID=1903569 RepID=UPI00254682D8|nr:uncharacterized protein N7474_001498 [Penicillium riverlandense]KAJ5833187.1 hypothetical protein N7474_001498 [Penicillium riverlandense]